MTKKLLSLVATASVAALTALAPAATAQNTEVPRSLTLFNDEDLQGTPVQITEDTANLQGVSATDGFDGTANDYAYSLRTEGRWLVCMDAGFQTDCREVDGELRTLGAQGGSISSARYLGPSPRQAVAQADTSTPSSVPPSGAMTSTRSAPPTSPAPTRSASAAPAAPAWQPMYNVDLFGGDYREITYSSPGNGWEQCKAACEADSQCRAFTYVVPGRQPHGECFLKDTVPEASESDCCVSGIKGAPSAGNARGSAAINGVMRRLGERAGETAERKTGEKIDEAIGRAFDRAF